MAMNTFEIANEYASFHVNAPASQTTPRSRKRPSKFKEAAKLLLKGSGTSSSPRGVQTESDIGTQTFEKITKVPEFSDPEISRMADEVLREHKKRAITKKVNSILSSSKHASKHASKHVKSEAPQEDESSGSAKDQKGIVQGEGSEGKTGEGKGDNIQGSETQETGSIPVRMRFKLALRKIVGRASQK